MEDKPYSFLVPDTDWAFIHITKTGGTSIRRYLKMPELSNATGKKHMGYDEMRKMIHPQRFSELRFFAVVREPFDRIRSYWQYLMRERTEAGEDTAPFDKFLQQKLIQERRGNIQRLQSDYLKEQGAFQDHVHLLRFENLESEFKAFAKSNEMKTLETFPHQNSSFVPERFNGDYTPAMRDLVREFFQEDFERFGYPMDPDRL